MFMQGILCCLAIILIMAQSGHGGSSGYSKSYAAPSCSYCGGTTYVSSNPCSSCGGSYAPAPSPCGGGCYGSGGGVSPAFSTGQNVGAAVAGAIHDKIDGVAGFVNGLVSGRPVRPSCGSGGCGGGCGSGGCGGGYGGGYGTSGCGSGGCGGGGSTTVVVVQQPSHTSSCGSGGCGSSYGSGSWPSSGGCGSGGCGSVVTSHASSYPNCQCDWLFNDAGQGNCNIGAHSKTADRWCYVSNKVNGKWVEPQWACPDSRASDVHHGRYWSNVACDTPSYGK